MIRLTKEQAIKISELHRQWVKEHPDATRDQIEAAGTKIKYKILRETRS